MSQGKHPAVFRICSSSSSGSGYFCIVFCGLFPEQELLGACATCNIAWILHVSTIVNKAKCILCTWLFPREMKLIPKSTKIFSNSQWEFWKIFCITLSFLFEVENIIYFFNVFKWEFFEKIIDLYAVVGNNIA